MAEHHHALQVSESSPTCNYADCAAERHLACSKKPVALTRPCAMKCTLATDFTCSCLILILALHRWMSKEPAEIFERAAEDGFIAQVSANG
jgi:hypothetical protein